MSNWITARGRIKEQWSMFTDEDLDASAGRRDALLTKVKENLRVTPEEADRQVTEWESKNRDLFAETAEQIKPYLGIAKQ
jgi:uncharacterized protein YjbJ (UPF0337 family)